MEDAAGKYIHSSSFIRTPHFEEEEALDSSSLRKYSSNMMMPSNHMSNTVISQQPVEASESHSLNHAFGKVPSSMEWYPDFKVHFRTYGNDDFDTAKRRIWNEANDTGWFDTVIAHGPEDLPRAFVEQYREILELPRGGGYWIWKIPVIEMALDQMNEGDMLVYADVGCTVVKEEKSRLYEYLEMIQKSPFNVLSFELPDDCPCLEFQYTTERIFRAFQIEISNEEIRSSQQFSASILILEKGDHVRQWLSLVKSVLREDPYIITDNYNYEAMVFNSSFVDNRHDQSIFSLSRKLVGSVVLFDETDPTYGLKVPLLSARFRDS